MLDSPLLQRSTQLQLVSEVSHNLKSAKQHIWMKNMVFFFTYKHGDSDVFTPAVTAKFHSFILTFYYLSDVFVFSPNVFVIDKIITSKEH